jgi:deazaflavin-dependent oxidoreductase (nitroreductase family)
MAQARQRNRRKAPPDGGACSADNRTAAERTGVGGIGLLRSAEVEFFRMLNRLVEPRVRAGCASPRLVPGGLVVLEVSGRKTGRRARLPLAATRIQDHLLVGTFRAARSGWVRNLAANPNVRVWVHGRPRAATALVISSPRAPRGSGRLPSLLQWVVAALLPYTHAGWAFAILAPARARRWKERDRLG